MAIHNHQLISVDKMPKNGLELPNKTLPFILHFLRQGWWQISIAAFFFGGYAFCNVITPVFVGKLVDGFQAGLTFNELLPIFITLALVGYVLLHLFALAGHQTAVMFHSYFREMVRMQLVTYTTKHSLAYFQKDFSGRISTKIGACGYSMARLADNLHENILSNLIGAVVVVWVMFQLDSSFVLIMLGWLAFYFAITTYILIPFMKASADSSDEWSKCFGRIVDAIANIQTVKLFAARGEEVRVLKNSAQKAAQKARIWYNWAMCLHIIAGICEAFIFVVLGYMALKNYSNGSMTAGEVVTVYMLIPVFLTRIWQLRAELITISDHVGIVRDAMQTLVHPQTVKDLPHATPLKVSKGAIAFNSVKFTYNNKQQIIKNLSLDIPSGQKVGLVGQSGAGKSTLVNLLLRFHDITGGSITIDGQNIAEVQQDTLRQNMAMVTQEPSLFHRSVLENIRYGKPDATLAEVKAAAKKAHAHDFIMKLEDSEGRKGYQAHVGERGVKLSGGQRQRIAIARIMLKDAPILLLDEATSALDSEVEEAIQENLATLMKGKTVIAIAHRLSTLNIMDRVVVMENGKITEDGTHKQLLKNKGQYAKLWQKQSGGFIGDKA